MPRALLARKSKRRKPNEEDESGTSDKEGGGRLGRSNKKVRVDMPVTRRRSGRRGKRPNSGPVGEACTRTVAQERKTAQANTSSVLQRGRGTRPATQERKTQENMPPVLQRLERGRGTRLVTQEARKTQENMPPVLQRGRGRPPKKRKAGSAKEKLLKPPQRKKAKVKKVVPVQDIDADDEGEPGDERENYEREATSHKQEHLRRMRKVSGHAKLKERRSTGAGKGREEEKRKHTKIWQGTRGRRQEVLRTGQSKPPLSDWYTVTISKDKSAMYVCETCGQEFRKLHQLQRHLPVHTNERKYKCGACGKGFRQASTLSRHHAVHTSERPHRCQYCSKTFNRHSTLIAHVKIHTDTKQHKCPICSKAFHQKGNLKTHVFIHTGEKPYRCDVCQRAFNQMSNLTNHLANVHGPHKSTPFICFCKQEFMSSHDLRWHQRQSHNVRASEVAVGGGRVAGGGRTEGGRGTTAGQTSPLANGEVASQPEPPEGSEYEQIFWQVMRLVKKGMRIITLESLSEWSSESPPVLLVPDFWPKAMTAVAMSEAQRGSERSPPDEDAGDVGETSDGCLDSLLENMPPDGSVWALARMKDGTQKLVNLLELKRAEGGDDEPGTVESQPTVDGATSTETTVTEAHSPDGSTNVSLSAQPAGGVILQPAGTAVASQITASQWLQAPSMPQVSPSGGSLVLVPPSVQRWSLTSPSNKTESRKRKPRSAAASRDLSTSPASGIKFVSPEGLNVQLLPSVTSGNTATVPPMSRACVLPQHPIGLRLTAPPSLPVVTEGLSGVKLPSGVMQVLAEPSVVHLPLGSVLSPAVAVPGAQVRVVPQTILPKTSLSITVEPASSLAGTSSPGSRVVLLGSPKPVTSAPLHVAPLPLNTVTGVQSDGGNQTRAPSVDRRCTDGREKLIEDFDLSQVVVWKMTVDKEGNKMLVGTSTGGQDGSGVKTLLRKKIARDKMAAASVSLLKSPSSGSAREKQVSPPDGSLPFMPKKIQVSSPSGSQQTVLVQGAEVGRTLPQRSGLANPVAVESALRNSKKVVLQTVVMTTGGKLTRTLLPKPSTRVIRQILRAPSLAQASQRSPTGSSSSALAGASSLMGDTNLPSSASSVMTGASLHSTVQPASPSVLSSLVTSTPPQLNLQPTASPSSVVMASGQRASGHLPMSLPSPFLTSLAKSPICSVTNQLSSVPMSSVLTIVNPKDGSKPSSSLSPSSSPASLVMDNNCTVSSQPSAASSLVLSSSSLTNVTILSSLTKSSLPLETVTSPSFLTKSSVALETVTSPSSVTKSSLPLETVASPSVDNTSLPLETVANLSVTKSSLPLETVTGPSPVTKSSLPLETVTGPSSVTKAIFPLETVSSSIPVTRPSSPVVPVTSPSVTKPSSPVVPVTIPPITKPSSPIVLVTSPSVTKPSSPVVPVTNHPVTKPSSPVVPVTNPSVTKPSSPVVPVTSPPVTKPSSPVVPLTSPPVTKPSSPVVPLTSPSVTKPSSPVVSVTAPSVTKPSSPTVLVTSYPVTKPSSPVVPVTTPSVTKPSSPVVPITSPPVAKPSSPVVPVTNPPVTKPSYPVVPVTSPPVTKPSSPTVPVTSSPVTKSSSPVVPVISPPLTKPSSPVVPVTSPPVTKPSSPVVPITSPSVTKPSSPVVPVTSPLVTKPSSPVIPVTSPAVTKPSSSSFSVNSPPVTNPSSSLVLVTSPSDSASEVTHGVLVKSTLEVSDNQTRPFVTLTLQTLAPSMVQAVGPGSGPEVISQLDVLSQVAAATAPVANDVQQANQRRQVTETASQSKQASNTVGHNKQVTDNTTGQGKQFTDNTAGHNKQVTDHTAGQDKQVTDNAAGQSNRFTEAAGQSKQDTNRAGHKKQVTDNTAGQGKQVTDDATG